MRECNVPVPLRALPFASSRRSLTHTLGHSQWPKPPRFVHAFSTHSHQPDSGCRVTVLARSGHSPATEEPAPSVTPPPTSVHVIVRCGDTPVVLRSLDDRCERHKRASCAWSAYWPASPKGRIESEPRGPSQLRGVRGVSTHGTVQGTMRMAIEILQRRKTTNVTIRWARSSGCRGSCSQLRRPVSSAAP